MHFDTDLLAARRTTCRASGAWPGRTINDDLDVCRSTCPDRLALVARRSDGGTTRRFTYRQLATMVDRVAVGLAQLGVGRNDVVAVQLPNWWQFTVTYLACARLGAVINPLMPIFRERELAFMLRHGGAKVAIVPHLFRGFDHEQMLAALAPELPALEHVVVVDGGGSNSFEALLAEPAWENHAEAQWILTDGRPGGDDVTQLMFTSGTTGEPKGVMHTANTLYANLLPFLQRMRLTCADVIYMASPMAHQVGFMYGLMLPVVLRAGAVLQDVWDPAVAVELIRQERCSFTMASTPFLNDLTQQVEASGQQIPSLRIFQCAGAPIPGSLVERARAVTGTKIVSGWGMTELGVATLTELEDDDTRSATTDGRPLPSTEIKIVDPAGVELPPGRQGALMVRGCSNFAGYLHRPHLNATDADGWFDTGDLARIDEAGYIRISGRSKDLIIRGGENIPVVEIEALLYRHPAVEQVAIVAYDDERLGERACAVMTLKPGRSIQHAGMVAFLKEQGVALQYIPERLLVLPALPMTPSGKIQKFKLREQLRSQ